MYSNSKISRIKVGRSTAKAIAAGHPWVFGENHKSFSVGELVEFCDEHQKVVGWGLVDQGTISHRVLGRGPCPSAGLGATLSERVFRADRFRFLHMPAQTDAYRVVNGAGDGMPGVVVDRYGTVAVLRIYAEAWEAHLPLLIKALRKLPWVETVWRKYGVMRVDNKKGGALLYGAVLPEVLIVEEHGIRFIARPKTGQKTGLFLDQRTHRDLIRGWAAGREVVNLFAYNGGFSIAAAMGGAARVTTVDIAPDAIEDAKEIFRLNGLRPDDHAFVVADAFKWEPNGRVNLVVVDPPSLMKDKSHIRAGLRAYRNLHKRVGPWLPVDGLLATASCTARISRSEWMEAVEDGLWERGDWAWHWTSNHPTDHPVALKHSEAHYLKFGLLRRR